MNKPLIGVTPLYDYNLKSWWIIPGYLQGIEAAGGIAVMMPFSDSEENTAELVSHLDGVVFTGGPDVDPALYGEDCIMQLGLLAPKRDVNEKLILNAALKQGKAVLGICRGLQFINTMFGGSLYQDLDTQLGPKIDHDQNEKNYVPSHSVNIIPGTPLSEWFDGSSSLKVNSFHHQALKELGEGLSPMAAADPDGFVEAVYAPGEKFCVGVQWHPELLFASKDPEVHESAMRIFRALVDACR
ncbi:MAG: gamma-glutamyl-gamma-aminobutyrate hydrolase family protein [Eubacterium sp.]|jgi:putative glutamine amidotransferase